MQNNSEHQMLPTCPPNQSNLWKSEMSIPYTELEKCFREGQIFPLSSYNLSAGIDPTSQLRSIWGNWRKGETRVPAQH